MGSSRSKLSRPPKPKELGPFAKMIISRNEAKELEKQASSKPTMVTMATQTQDNIAEITASVDNIEEGEESSQEKYD